MKSALKKFVPTAEAFTRLLHPFAEVVIHDLAKDQIVAIYNPLSKRKVGDASYLDQWDFSIDLNENVIGPYEKTNYDGRKLKSISLVLRDDKTKAIGFLCVNVDISVFESYRNTLQLFLSNNDQKLTPQSKVRFKDDLYEQISLFIQAYCQENHLSLKSLSRADKQTLITKLEKEGALKGKNATNYIARILNISRATVYNYLKEK